MKRVLIALAFGVILTLALATTAMAAPANNCFCGGIAGIPCPDGYTCVDDPSDNCDPATGGADCGGICIAPSPACDGLANAQSHASDNGQKGIDRAQANNGCPGSGGSDDGSGGGGI